MMPSDRTTTWRSGWGADLRDALRSTVTAPGRSALVVVCLTLGIGLTVAAFAFANALVAGELSGVRERDRLMRLEVIREGYAASGPRIGEFRVMPAALPGGIGFGAEEPWRFSMNADGRAVFVRGSFVTGGFFPTLGTTPALGRLIQPADDRPGASPVVVLAYGFWQRHFGGSADVLGEEVLIGPRAHRVVGIAPPAFIGIGDADFDETAQDTSQIWVPMTGIWTYPGYAAAGVDSAIGPSIVVRLPEGVTRARAAATLQPLATVFSSAGSRDAVAIQLSPFWLVDSDAPVPLLFAAFLALPVIALSIACANVAGLQLARAVSRTQELAVRTALGAGRGRIARLLGLEIGLLAILAAAAAWAAVSWAAGWSARLLPFPVAVDGRVVGFTMLAALAATLLAGMLPGWRATGFDVLSGLRLGPQAGRGAGRGLRRGVVAGQIAASVLLVTLALTMTRVVAALPALFGPLDAGLLTAQVSFEDLDIDQERQGGMRRAIVDAVQALPGVGGLAVSTSPLLNAYGAQGACWPETRERPPLFGTRPRVRDVTPAYFSVVRAELRAGRLLAPGDTDVIVVSESFAAGLPDPDRAVGSVVGIGRWDEPSRLVRIVGVVADGYERDAAGRGSLCYALMAPDGPGSFSLFVRTASAGSVKRALERILADQDPLLAPREMGTAAELLDRRYRAVYQLADALSALGASGLLLALVGLLGVVAYTTAQRTREFGVRLAFGARPRDLVWDVTREAGWMTVVGGTAGVLLFVPIRLFLRTDRTFAHLPDADPWLVLGVVSALATLTLAASLMPARRVAAIDPVAALRTE